MTWLCLNLALQVKKVRRYLCLALAVSDSGADNYIFNAGVRMCVERPLKEPVMVDSLVAVPDKGVIGKTFKKDAKVVQEALAALTIEDAEKMDKTLTESG